MKIVERFFFIFLLFGLFCCTPRVTEQPKASSCQLVIQSQPKEVYEYKDSEQLDILSGTEWVVKVDDWKVNRHDITTTRQLVLSKETHPSVDIAVGSISVIPWQECGSKFAISHAIRYAEVNGAKPISEALVDINGHDWYLYSFTIGHLSGIFAATATLNNGLILECVAKGGSFDDHIDICSEFVVKFIVKAEKKQKGTYL